MSHKLTPLAVHIANTTGNARDYGPNAVPLILAAAAIAALLLTAWSVLCK